MDESTRENCPPAEAASLVGARRTLFEKIVTVHTDPVPRNSAGRSRASRPASSEHVQGVNSAVVNNNIASFKHRSACHNRLPKATSRVSLRTLPLNDHRESDFAIASDDRTDGHELPPQNKLPPPIRPNDDKNEQSKSGCNAASRSSSTSDSDCESSSPEREEPAPSLVDDAAFAKRISYHNAVFKNSKLILASDKVAIQTPDKAIAEEPSSAMSDGEEAASATPADPVPAEKCQPLPDDHLHPPSASVRKKENISAQLADNAYSTHHPPPQRTTDVESDTLPSPSQSPEAVAAAATVEVENASAITPDREGDGVEDTNDNRAVIVDAKSEVRATDACSSSSSPPESVINCRDLSSAKDDRSNNVASSSRNSRVCVVDEAVATETLPLPPPAPLPSHPYYPQELNPFSEDEEEAAEEEAEPLQKSSLNPFGSDSESDAEDTPKKSTTNPFGSDSEDEGVDEPQPRTKSQTGSTPLVKTPVPLPRRTARTPVMKVSPQPSPRRSVGQPSPSQEVSPAKSCSLNAQATCGRLSADMSELNLARPSGSANSTLRKKKPAAPRPPSIQMKSENNEKHNSVTEPVLNSQLDKEMSKDTSAQHGDMTAVRSPWKNKKGPAPARPTPQRRPVKEMPLEDIKIEINDIEVREQELERQAVGLEQTIREKTETESAESPIVEEMVVQLFELVNEKNELFRRRSELINMRKMHQLEEEHAELEYQIRCLMLKPASNKTDNDKEKEEELIKRLLQVVERRNEIIEAMEKDRQRETVEDHSVTTQLENDVKASDRNGKDDKKKKKKKKKDKNKEGADKAYVSDNHSSSQLIKQKFLTLKQSAKKLQLKVPS